MMKSLTNLAIVFLFSSLSFAQNVSILKDSICVSHDCFELQELKINTKNTEAYKKIQKSFDVFNGFLFDIPEKRLQAKKDTLKSLISKNSLRESQYGFEKYEILFDKKGLLNLSMKIQSYGSPWENTKYYFFDINNNTQIGDNLFINKKKLLFLCKKKIKNEEGQSFNMKSLSQYKLNTNSKGKVIGISIIFYDEENGTNSGYPQYLALFKWKEIEKFISQKYRNSLLQD
ncbi:hypothetical protein NAL32_19060 [Chryseobacterium sp. Ch-15]|uniref:GLPGLI family protein n=1 Tax=Chryseobacterium muglaense TaxID=2893752 RepID=A0A9Q3YTK5_9FLAO|nr:hypothetical protein [Chryseobacterium muglaense]MBD3906713.1 hypothetical protein [Chryseobacterium muglaense]MCC9036623.1 hypothetical protein [Chryseobacterium muglaense]MCM2556493.1 hypothetical protein [Chryseobacterium muglaense]